MQVVKTDLAQTGYFSDLFLDYLNQKGSLKKFYDLFPEKNNFHTKAQSLNFPSEKRNILHQSLLKQYETVEMKTEVRKNIDSLKNENSFTITTGHQLNLFSGPLYFIYKIVSIINTAQKLNEENKGIHYVPVYWMASEDHDIEEINHFYLFNKKFTWETDQKGPVGRFRTEGIEKIFSEIKDSLPLFEKAYLEHNSLAEATRYFVNELFGDKGLIVIDGDDKELKLEFSEIIKDELIHQTSYKEVATTSDELKKLGYSLQMNPREINLFYLKTGIRERIIKEGSNYTIAGEGLNLPIEEMLTMTSYDSQVFSPNVVLRPVYQQLILPNVSYCGGPAEISYWLQLKSLCDHYKVPFPILLPRNFALVINSANFNKLSKSNIQPEDLFLEDHKIKEKIVEQLGGQEYKLINEIESLENIFQSIKEKGLSIDATLEGFVLAEKQKIIKILEGIEKRFKKSEEGKNETSISQALNIKSKLFPEGQLQERRDNFLNFYINDASFIEKLISHLDSFDYRFNILIENE